MLTYLPRYLCLYSADMRGLQNYSSAYRYLIYTASDVLI